MSHWTSWMLPWCLRVGLRAWYWKHVWIPKLEAWYLLVWWYHFQNVSESALPSPFPLLLLSTSNILHSNCLLTNFLPFKPIFHPITSFSYLKWKLNHVITLLETIVQEHTPSFFARHRGLCNLAQISCSSIFPGSIACSFLKIHFPFATHLSDFSISVCIYSCFL